MRKMYFEVYRSQTCVYVCEMVVGLDWLVFAHQCFFIFYFFWLWDGCLDHTTTATHVRLHCQNEQGTWFVQLGYLARTKHRG